MGFKNLGLFEPGGRKKKNLTIREARQSLSPLDAVSSLVEGERGHS
jgi:hypothetical protein